MSDRQCNSRKLIICIASMTESNNGEEIQEKNLSSIQEDHWMVHKSLLENQENKKWKEMCNYYLA